MGILKSTCKRLYYPFSFLIISLFPFLLILVLPQNGVLKTISAIIRYNNPIVLFSLVLLLLFGFLIKDHRVSNLFIVFIIFSFFALALKGLWVMMYTEKNIIAGILPRRDALSYFGSAMSFLEQSLMVGYSTRRPIFSAFLAALLWLTGNHLTINLVILAYLSALVVFFSLMETRASLNPFSAIIFFIPQFLYYRFYIGNVMSESLAFILAVLAFAFFLRYYRQSGLKTYTTINLSLAVFCFALAQFTRPGAIVTLPLLPLFIILGPAEKHSKRQALVLTLIAIFAAFLLDKAFFTFFTAGNTAHNSNAFNGLYGVVSGGKFWWQLDRDYPHIQNLAANMRTRESIRVILNTFCSNPLNFFKGMTHQFSVILSLNPITTYNIYAYMLSNNAIFDIVLIASYYLFYIAGIFSAFKYISRPLNKLALLFLLGFLLSLPIAPAYHEQYMRFYPASIPLLGFLPALGLALVVDSVMAKIKHNGSIFPHVNMDYFSNCQIVFALPLLAFLTFAPVLIYLLNRNEPVQPDPCPQGLDSVLVPYYPATHININTYDQTGLPGISDSKFKLGIHNIPNQSDMQAFDAIPLPASVFPSFDLITDTPLYVIMPPADIPARKTTLNLCGSLEEWPGLILFYPQNAPAP